MESRDKAETIRTPVISRTTSSDYIVFRNEKVVNCLYRNRNALFRLVCFPWGGGGSTFFAKWGQDIPNSVEVHAIRLAGRESRLDEPFASDMKQVVDEIACALLPIIQGEHFAFFGHSMGSYIAFFTALHLKEKYNLEPVHLFVSSISPPCAQLRFLKDDMRAGQIEFLLKKMGGTPEDFVDDEELSQESVTKVLADLHILKDVIYDTHSKTRLSCDITCFSGSEDIPVDMEAWKDVTSGNFDSFVLPGHHFYLLETSNTSFIKKYITKSLEISVLTS